jgi:hypothetical protein
LTFASAIVSLTVNPTFSDFAGAFPVGENGQRHQGAGQGGLRQQISTFLEWSKPYREIIALGVSIILAISGAVAWAVAHFATQTAVSNLECKLTHQLTSQLHGSHANLYAAQIDARESQVKQLSSQNPPISGAPVKTLMDEVDTLKGKQDPENEASKDQLNEALVVCR